jgi:methylthioribose-1-phosphate isomerase
MEVKGRMRVTASNAANPAFDVTSTRLVTGYITERGVLTRRSEWPGVGRCWASLSA